MLARARSPHPGPGPREYSFRHQRPQTTTESSSVGSTEGRRRQNSDPGSEFAYAAETLARLASCDALVSLHDIALRPLGDAAPRPAIGAVVAAGSMTLRDVLIAKFHLANTEDTVEPTPPTAIGDDGPSSISAAAPAVSGRTTGLSLEQIVLDVPAREAIVDVFLGMLYGNTEALTHIPTRELWEVADICRRMRVVTALSEAVEVELSRRDDAVDVNDVFRVLTAGCPEDASPAERGRVAAARKYVREHFVELSHGEQWTSLDFATVERVLRMNDLHVPAGELDVFKALLRWSRSPYNSHADSVRLLRYIRFPTMLDRQLLAAVRCDVFFGDDIFYRMILEAFVRRAEVRVIYAPRNAARVARASPKYGSAVSESLLIHRRTPGAPVSHARLNARDVRTAAFKGTFPLALYRHMRFRPRSGTALLFTAVIPNWSKVTRRIRTESRSFLDHKWSIWVDPYVYVDTVSTQPALSDADGGAESLSGTYRHGYIQRYGSSGSAALLSTATSSVGRSGSIAGMDDAAVAGRDSDPTSQYMSMFLCCQSDMGGEDKSVDVTVDYSLFIASAADPYVMERKVCAAKSFTTNGQASGFRLHTRRSLVNNPDAGLYDAENDELVVGAHIVALRRGAFGEVTSNASTEPVILPMDASKWEETGPAAEPTTADPVGSAKEYASKREHKQLSSPSLPPRSRSEGVSPSLRPDRSCAPTSPATPATAGDADHQAARHTYTTAVPSQLSLAQQATGSTLSTLSSGALRLDRT